ncbi:MAG: fasciclin domain-containing protein [Sandaracinaceae bacterium]
MTRSSKWLTAASALLALTFVHCGGSGSGTDMGPTGSDEGPPPDLGPVPDEGSGDTSVVEVLQREDLSTFRNFALSADLLDELGDAPAVTVFAPTEDAWLDFFTDLGLTEAALVADVDRLDAFMRYHVVPERLTPTDLNAPGFASTWAEEGEGPTVFYRMATEGLELNGGPGEVTSGGAAVLANEEASNGYVFVIDRVLLPPSLVDVLRYARSSDIEGFQDLANAIEARGLGAQLDFDIATVPIAGLTAFTLMAPVDSVFPDSPPPANVLLYHVLQEAFATSELPEFANTQAAQTFEDGEGGFVDVPLTMAFDRSTTPIEVNGGPPGQAGDPIGATITIEDVRALNGVVHVIDAVLQPLTLRELLLAAGLDTFSEAATDAALVPPPWTPGGIGGGDTFSYPEILEGAPLGGGLTVFAPIDIAFQSVPTDPGELLFLIAQHIIPGDLPLRVRDLPTDPAIRLDVVNRDNPRPGLTFEAAAVPPRVTPVSGLGSPGDPANLLNADLGATNGILHTIDVVLEPGTP